MKLDLTKDEAADLVKLLDCAVRFAPSAMGGVNAVKPLAPILAKLEKATAADEKKPS